MSEPSDDDDVPEKEEGYANVHGTVELREEDFVEAQVAFAAERGHVKSIRQLLGLFLFITCVSVILAWPVSFGLWALLIPTLTAALFLVGQQRPWMGRGAFANLPVGRRRFELSLRDEGVFTQSERVNTSYGWRLPTGWLESTNLFVLLGSRGVLDLWPKRSFANEDLAEIRALLEDVIEVETPAKRVPKGRPVATLLIWVLLIIVVVAIVGLWRTR